MRQQMSTSSIFWLEYILVCILLVIVQNLQASSDIPVIDISALLLADGGDQELVYQKKEVVLQQLDDAARNYGCFIIMNYTKNPIYSDEAILRSGFDLFSLSDEAKKKHQFNATNHFGRGYLSFGSESGLSEYFEPKEGYSYGYPDAQSTDYGWLTSPNHWPEEYPTSDRFQLELLYQEFSSVANLLIQSLIRYRKAHDLFIDDLAIEKGHKISLMRLFHYFVVDETMMNDKSNKKFLGSSPHTDWGLLTIILHNSIPGLQFYHDQTWKDIPNTVPHSLAINIGDYFSLATRDDYKSPIHRVLTPQQENRLSFVFFFYPNYQSRLIQSEKTTALLASSSPKTCRQGGESCQEEQPTQEDLHFNTLTVSEDQQVHYQQGRGDFFFGDYILYKWKSVLRG